MDNIFIKLAFFAVVIIAILKLTGAVSWEWEYFIFPFIGLVVFDFVIYSINETYKRKKSGRDIDKMIKTKGKRNRKL